MKAHPAIGDFYRQEFLLNEAEDLAEVGNVLTHDLVTGEMLPLVQIKTE
jgi:hypothetical protein